MNIQFTTPASRLKRSDNKRPVVVLSSGLANVMPRGWCFKFPHHHDDVIKWKPFPRYWPFVRGIHRSPVNSRHKGQWRGALVFCLICAWINGWVNIREAGDLRRHRAHYDVIVMTVNMADDSASLLLWGISQRSGHLKKKTIWRLGDQSGDVIGYWNVEFIFFIFHFMSFHFSVTSRFRSSIVGLWRQQSIFMHIMLS